MRDKRFTARQRSGSEYGGVAETRATIQPKGADALTNSEILRLGYLTGVENDTESIEDRRQMLGLRPADGRRPIWLDHVSPTERLRLQSEARRQGFGSEAGRPVTSEPDIPLDDT